MLFETKCTKFIFSIINWCYIFNFFMILNVKSIRMYILCLLLLPNVRNGLEKLLKEVKDSTF